MLLRIWSQEIGSVGELHMGLYTIGMVKKALVPFKIGQHYNTA